MKDIEMARRIAEKVADAGGLTYYVGGCVRDALLHMEIKDVDIEVHGIEVRALEEILDSLGERITIGASFGVFGLRHYGLDIAMPRTEKATGRGHRDFAVFVDPYIGTQKAARRRDFTVNAMMQDVLTGEILDFYGGRKDLERGILRHVNDQSFAEDALRVLRAAQFAARFGFAVAEETVRLCSAMDLSALAPERVQAETDKALLKAGAPSVYFETLKNMRQTGTWFPEIHALSSEAYAKTMHTLDRAAALRESAEYKEGFMVAALFLECESFDTNTLCPEIRRAKYVKNMVPLAARPDALVAQSADKVEFMRLFDACVSPEDLLLLARASRERDSRNAEKHLEDILEQYHLLKNTKQVMGADLIGRGFAPSPLFSRALSFAHDLWLRGAPYAEALRETVSFMERGGES